MGYDFDVHYKPGSSNRVADALSKKTVGEVVLGATVALLGVNWDKLEKEIASDRFLTHVKAELQAGTGLPHFSLVRTSCSSRGGT